jgi:transketolase
MGWHLRIDSRKKVMGPATRDAYGQALVEIGAADPRVVAVDADLSKSTKSGLFAKKFPERFFNCGIAEANMVSVAAGLASCGKIPFAHSFASFLLCKAFDQIRMSIANPRLNVKLVGSHGGISLGEDGASQQSVEDFALACALPGVSVMSPSDAVSCKALTHLAAQHIGPVYLRTGRPKTPLLYAESEHFEWGVAKKLVEGRDVTIIANGLLVWEALMAAEICAQRGIEVAVIDMHTLKPMDVSAVVSAASETEAIVTAEEHLLAGGLGSRVAHLLALHHPVPMASVGLSDTYAESGPPEALFEKYGLTAEQIVSAVESVLKRKK